MKRKLSFLCCGIVLVIAVYICINDYSPSTVLEGKVKYVEGNSGSDALAMLLETDTDSGEYEESTSETWPDESEYTFNDNLSSCENGSVVYWDSETKQVVMIASVSDKCYIYFDKN